MTVDIKSLIEGTLMGVKIFFPERYEEARQAALAIQEAHEIAQDGNLIRLTANLTVMLSNVKAGKELLS